MYNVKLAEPQRPVLLRDGRKGPMRVVTAHNWVKFETIGEWMQDDNSLVIEPIKDEPAPVAVAEPVVEAEPVVAQPIKKKTRTRRKPKPETV